MKKTSLYVLVWFCLLSLAIRVLAHKDSAPAPVSTRVMEKGLYAIRRLAPLKNSTLPVGRVHVVSRFMLLSATNRIPAVSGNTFGYRCKIDGGEEGKVIKMRTVYIFPKQGLHDPEKEKPVFQGSCEMPAVVGGEMVPSYTFDHQWELVPGEWTIQLWHENRKLSEEVFDVYLPEKGVAGDP